MKIAIVGMGVAGAHLAGRLQAEHQVTGFDRLREDRFDAVCAWGTSRYEIAKLSKGCGLNFEDYVLHDGKNIYVDLGDEIINIKLKGLCCFDKLKFIQDSASQVKINYGKNISKLPPNGDFDLVIDSTGLPRALLPRLANEIWIPCVQYKVKYHRQPPFDDFYIKPSKGLSGYFWYFPLGNNTVNVGAGDYRKGHNEELQLFLKKYDCEIIGKVGRPIRITPPSMCEPFFDGRVVGVGESIGTVYPMLGEGIIPSLQCAELFVENIYDLKKYREKVLEKFAIYTKVFNFIKAKIQADFSLLSNFTDMLSMYFHMRSNQKRYGMEIKLRDMMKVVRS